MTYRISKRYEQKKKKKTAEFYFQYKNITEIQITNSNVLNSASHRYHIHSKRIVYKLERVRVQLR